MNSIVRNPKKIFTVPGGDPIVSTRVTNLENNEYKITYYEIISGTSGSLTIPSGATINQGEFGLSGNAVLSKIDGSNKPIFESPKTSSGVIVTANLNSTTGAWLTSGTYSDSNVALIYSIKIKAINYHNLTYDNIIESEDLQSNIDLKLPIQADSTTGVSLTFLTDTVYGSIATPETGNITYSSTGAKLGVTNIIIHNNGTAPTFASNMKKLSGSGNYVTGSINYIYVTYINSTEIIYSINQRS
jgi:hypothetical protein